MLWWGWRLHFFDNNLTWNNIYYSNIREVLSRSRNHGYDFLKTQDIETGALCKL